MRTKIRKYVEVYYDPDLRNWDAGIEAELKRRGLEHGKITVVARPKKINRSDLKALEAYQRETRENCGGSPN